MTPEEHQARHVELHNALDELFTDWITHVGKTSPTKCPIIDLLSWSRKQTLNPDHDVD